MAKDTTRDRLWTFAIKRTHRDDGAIDAAELSKMAESTERSARDVLKTMATNGILREERKGGRIRYIAEWGEV